MVVYFRPCILSALQPIGIDWLILRGVPRRREIKLERFRESLRRCSFSTDRLHRQIEIDTSSPLKNCALTGIARSQVESGMRRRVRPPVTWSMLVSGKYLIPTSGPGGRVMWLCLGLSYFSIARSGEMFAGSSGVVHPAHCLTRRDVAVFGGIASWNIYSGDGQIR